MPGLETRFLRVAGLEVPAIRRGVGDHPVEDLAGGVRDVDRDA